MRIRLDSDTLAYMQLFSTITHVSPVDCFDFRGMLVFVVPGEVMGKAIGRGGKTVKMLSKAFGKDVAIFPYSKNVQTMAKLLFPDSEDAEDGDSIIVSVPSTARSDIMRNKRYLNIKKMIVKRLFGKELMFKWI